MRAGRGARRRPFARFALESAREDGRRARRWADTERRLRGQLAQLINATSAGLQRAPARSPAAARVRLAHGRGPRQLRQAHVGRRRQRAALRVRQPEPRRHSRARGEPLVAHRDRHRRDRAPDRRARGLHRRSRQLPSGASRPTSTFRWRSSRTHSTRSTDFGSRDSGPARYPRCWRRNPSIFCHGERAVQALDRTAGCAMHVTLAIRVVCSAGQTASEQRITVNSSNSAVAAMSESPIADRRSARSRRVSELHEGANATTKKGDPRCQSRFHGSVVSSCSSPRRFLRARRTGPESSRARSPTMGTSSAVRVTAQPTSSFRVSDARRP